MNDRIVPAHETLAAHEQAATEVAELRKKGIHCHLEENAHHGGHCIDVIRDPEGHIEPPPPPPRRMKGLRSS